MKDNEKREIILVLSALGIILVSIVIAIILQGESTGNTIRKTGDLIYQKDDTPDNITVEAGSVNLMVLSVRIFPYWDAFYGNLTNNRSKDGITLKTNVTFDVPYKKIGVAACDKTELYLTPTDTHFFTNFDITLPSQSYMDSLTAATTNQFDTYFDFTNLTSTYNISKAAAIFTETMNVSVGKNNLSIPGTKLNATSGQYELGILKNEDGEIILVSKIKNGSFENRSMNFMVMLPVSPKKNLTFYAFQDIADRDHCPYLYKQFIVYVPVIEYVYVDRPVSGKSKSSSGKGTQIVERIVKVKVPVNVTQYIIRNQTIMNNTKKDTISNDELEAQASYTSAKNIVEQNPECYELTELLRRVEDALDSKNYVEANLLSKTASKGCQGLLQKKPGIESPLAKVQGIMKPSNPVVLPVLFLTLILLVMMYSYNRLRKNRTS